MEQALGEAVGPAAKMTSTVALKPSVIGMRGVTITLASSWARTSIPDRK